MSEPPTEHFDHAEHAEHVAHSGDPFLAKVAITIATLAVLSAAVGSLETLETAATIRDKTTAAILQNNATDIWGKFSRESIKKTMYEIAAATPGIDASRTDNQAKAKDYEQRSRTTEKDAHEKEHRVDEANESSHHHEHRHEVLTVSATLMHIAIAVATIAIVMRSRRWPFYAAVVLGILGTIGAAVAFL